LIGWVRDATGSFEGGLLTLAGVLVAGAAIALSLPAGPPIHTDWPPIADRGC
jgi:hypothetical protein